MEKIFINNLWLGENNQSAWEIMEQENMDYLGESWNTTREKMEGEEESFFNQLPEDLRAWVDIQWKEQTDIFYSIQAVGTSIRGLGSYLIISNIINTFNWTEWDIQNLSKYIGWSWHILHSEF